MNITIEKEPTVTVYITNYNYERYVEQAIKSVLSQVYQDFELLIFDDGSTDGSREIIARYESHPKIRIFLQENRGLNATNNIAVRAARGKYVMRLDADDYLDPNALLVLVHALEEHPEVALIFPDFYYVDADGNITGQERRHNFRDDVRLLDQPAHGACTVIRRDSLLEVGGYSQGFRCQDGVDLWLKIIERFPVRNVNLPLFYYRRHAENLTNDTERLARARAEIIRTHAERVGRAPLTSIAVIPVRGRVVDPRDLALATVGDKTLLEWTVDAALGASGLSEVIVTSPDPAVLGHVREVYGERITVRERPKDLAGANTSYATARADALKHKRTEARPDAVIDLTVDYPFRDSVYVDKAVNTMRVFDADVVVAVSPESELLYHHDGSGLRPLPNLGDEAGLRLERNLLYRHAGGVQVWRRSSLDDGATVFKSRVGHIVLSRRAALRVVDSMDLKIARALAVEDASG